MVDKSIRDLVSKKADIVHSHSGYLSMAIPTYPSSYTAFTCDGNWNDVDISGTYGASEHMVLLFISTMDGASGQHLSLRPKGSSSTTIYHNHKVANVVDNQWVFCPTDSNGVFQYLAQSGLTWANYQIIGVLT